MRELPLILAIANASFTIVIFALAIHNPEKSGLLPILVFFCDFPASLCAEWLRDLLHDGFGITGRLTIDGAVYAIIGFLWFYLIGHVLRAIILNLRDFA